MHIPPSSVIGQSQPRGTLRVLAQSILALLGLAELPWLQATSRTVKTARRTRAIDRARPRATMRSVTPAGRIGELAGDVVRLARKIGSST